WRRWSRPGPDRGGRTSSPPTWSPSPAKLATPSRRCAARSWPKRSSSGSGSGCTRARWSGRWPAPPPRKAPGTTETSGERADLDDIARYERLREQALSGDADGWRLGLGVLHNRGIAGWLRAWDGLPAACPPMPEPASRPAPGSGEQLV